jgi:hypothetical protein
LKKRRERNDIKKVRKTYFKEKEKLTQDFKQEEID